MLSGVGLMAFLAKGPVESTIGQLLSMPVYLLDFQLNAEDEDAREAQAWIGGKRVTVASAPGDQRDRLVISHSYLDWYHMQFASDEIAQNVTRTLPVFKEGRVPSSAPYEIVDTDVVAGVLTQIACSVTKRGSWGEAGYLTRATGAPSARQFQPTATGTKLVFPSSLAGAPVAYQVPVEYANIPSIGVASDPVRFGQLEFVGRAYGPEFPNGVFIHIPLVSRRSRPNLSTADDVPTLEYQFDCLVAPGEREAVHKYLLPAA